jgi:hypothetical protein
VQKITLIRLGLLCAPANWKKGFYTNRDPNNQDQVGSFLYQAAQNSETFQIFKTEIKKSEPYSG